MTNGPRLAALLKKSPLFAVLKAEDLARLAASARVRRCARGQFVCHAGEPARELFLMLEGRVSISRSGWNGSRRSVEFMVPGDVFGLPALASLSYPNEIQARAPSLIAGLPKSEVSDLVRRVPGLAQTFFEILAKRLQLVETMLALSNQPVERRLAAALLYLREKFGEEIPLSRAEVAEMAGAAPETAMRMLKRFEDAGLVKRRLKGLSVTDAAALSRDPLAL